VLIMSDDSHNRMRVLARVGRLEALDAGILLRLLEANLARRSMPDTPCFAARFGPCSCIL
jgi:hypothetical protein